MIIAPSYVPVIEMAEGRDRLCLCYGHWKGFIEEETSGLCFQRLFQILRFNRRQCGEMGSRYSRWKDKTRHEKVKIFGTLFITRYLYQFFFPCPYSYNLPKSHSPPEELSSAPEYQSFLIVAIRIPWCCLSAPDPDLNVTCPKSPISASTFCLVYLFAWSEILWLWLLNTELRLCHRSSSLQKGTYN